MEANLRANLYFLCVWEEVRVQTALQTDTHLIVGGTQTDPRLSGQPQTILWLLAATVRPSASCGQSVSKLQTGLCERFDKQKESRDDFIVLFLYMVLMLSVSFIQY